jgi:NADH-quinone oxidoreductase subunit H
VATLVIVSIVAVIALAAAWIWDDRRAERAAAADEAPPEEIDPFEDGYPVPPLPGQRLVEPRPRLAAEPVLSTASSSSAGGSGTSTTLKEDTHG